jgi:hypothetical protein
LSEALNFGDGRVTSPVFAVDKKGRAHIIYDYRRQEGDKMIYHMAYARKRGGKWEVEKVGPDGEGVSMSLDRDGLPHVSFYDRNDDKVKYVRRTRTGWKCEVVARDLGYAVYTTSIGVDKAGRTHIVYDTNEYNRDALNYVRYSGDKAQAEVLPFEGRVGASALALDSKGRVHIAFQDTSRGDVRYAVKAGATWQIGVVDKRGWLGGGISMAFDRNDFPYLTYYSTGQEWYELRFARWTGKNWAIESVTHGEGYVKPYIWGARTSTAIDDRGRPCIAFLDPVNHYLQSARWLGGDWHPIPETKPEKVADRSEAGYTADWKPFRAMITPGKPWRPFAVRYSHSLRKNPDNEAEAVIEIERDTPVEVIDGRSRLVTYDYRGIDLTTYDTWFKVAAANREGWLSVGSVYPDVVNSAGGGHPDAGLVEFNEFFSPLREGPSDKAKVIGAEDSFAGAWELFWDVQPGTLYAALGRCGDWLCVGRGVSGAWLPLSTPGLKFYFLTFWWSPYDMADFAFYFPATGPVDRVIYYSWTYFARGRLPNEDPVLTIYTDADHLELIPQELSGYGGAEDATIYYEAVLPRPVQREKIKKVTFTVGVEPDRMRIEVDPREAWAEYNAER